MATSRETAPEQLFALDETAHADVFDGITHAWEALAALPAYLERLLAGLAAPDVHGRVHPAATLEGAVLIEEGAVVDPGAYISGPAVIGSGSHIRHGAYVRGGVLVGRDCIVGHATEVKGSILLDCARAPHFNYVGDSILGRDVNLGAGTILSNLKHNHQTIIVRIGSARVDSGLHKLGAILGDHTATGCNSVCSPGTVTGQGVWTYPNAMLRGYYPPGSVVKLRQETEVAVREGFEGS